MTGQKTERIRFDTGLLKNQVKKEEFKITLKIDFRYPKKRMKV